MYESSPLASIYNQCKQSNDWQFAYTEAIKFRNLSHNGHDKAYSRIIYEYVKQIREQDKIDEFKKILFFEIKNDYIEKPSFFYSLLAYQAYKLFKSKPKSIDFVKFLYIWGFENFHPSDFEEREQFTPRIFLYLRVLIEYRENKNIVFKLLDNIIRKSNINISLYVQKIFYNLLYDAKNDSNKQKQILYYYVNTYCTKQYFKFSDYHIKILNSAYYLDFNEKSDNHAFLAKFFFLWANILPEEKYLLEALCTPTIKDDKTFDSIFVTSLRYACDYLKKENVDMQLLTHFASVLYKVIDLIKSDNKIWILRDYAFILHKLNKDEAAIKILQDVIQIKKDWYLWKDLSEFVSDKKLKLSLLLKSFSSSKKDNFSINVLKNIIDLLKIQGEFHHSKFLFDSLNIQGKNAFSEKFPQITENINNISFDKTKSSEYFNSYETICSDFMWKNCPELDAIYIEHFHNKNKEFAKFADLASKKAFVLPYSALSDFGTIAPGTRLKVKGFVRDEKFSPQIISKIDTSNLWSGCDVTYGIIQKRDKQYKRTITLVDGIIKLPAKYDKFNDFDTVLVKKFNYIDNGKEKNKLVNKIINIELCDKIVALANFKNVSSKIIDNDNIDLKAIIERQEIKAHVASLPRDILKTELAKGAVATFYYYVSTDGGKPYPNIVAINNHIYDFT